MTKYAARISWPDVDEPIYIGHLENGEIGYAITLKTAALFDTPEAAVRVATSWAPSLEPVFDTGEVDA